MKNRKYWYAVESPDWFPIGAIKQSDCFTVDWGGFPEIITREYPEVGNIVVFFIPEDSSCWLVLCEVVDRGSDTQNRCDDLCDFHFKPIGALKHISDTTLDMLEALGDGISKVPIDDPIRFSSFKSIALVKRVHNTITPDSL